MAETAAYPPGMGTMPPAAPAIKMVPNDSFVFPPVESSSMSNHRRLKSMSAAQPRTNENTHRRGASALPAFSFNASDSSGLAGEEPSTDIPFGLTTPAQASSRGSHKRNTSEFVGGLGVNGAISSSPTRDTALPIPQRQHRYGHSRSQLTLSSHDLSSIMSPPEPRPRLSTSLPNTPLEHPASSSDSSRPLTAQSFGPPLDDSHSRPPSRPRVEFSDNVEYIPRPLSTISSGTGSSMSTMRGHSVNNSISSVLSLGSPSPPSARVRAPSLETTPEDEPRSIPKSSLEVSRRIEKEGQWLRNGTVDQSPGRPFSQPLVGGPQLTFAPERGTPRPRTPGKKLRPTGHSLNLDRRRSEPAIRICQGEASRLSALSLQDQAAISQYVPRQRSTTMDHRSSTRKLKDWAVSKLSRKSKEKIQISSTDRLERAQTPTPDQQVPEGESVVAETDLDAVFSLDSDSLPDSTARAHRALERDTQYVTAKPGSKSEDYDDCYTLLDLDAALGPFKTPQLGSQRPRRELHSSRGTKDFVGPGGHYLPDPNHRRTESAPMLAAFDYGRIGTPPQVVMDDVFEEDEDEEDEGHASNSRRPTSASSTQDEEFGVGVQIVDSDMFAGASTSGLSLDDDLRIARPDWELQRPTTSYGNVSSRLSTPIMDRRSSVIEDTIIEESSPIESPIVGGEEPRAQSLTKSSDSSETPTILADQHDVLALPCGKQFPATPESHQRTALSSPDMNRRQGSFHNSRLGTSASSITDNRTMSSCTTGEPLHETRISVDDVPSLTSSRSTMTSTMQPNTSRRDVSGARTPSSATLDSTVQGENRRKRSSVHSLSQYFGGPFGPRIDPSADGRPRTAAEVGSNGNVPKKEHRLKKLMFWKSKHRQASAATNP